MAKVVLNVPDISCEHCEHTVIHALTGVEGVRNVTVSIPTKQVRVDYDEGVANIESMKEVLQEEDYPVASVTTA